eukprot:5547050-Pyramimonas_sp.AAC.1
MKETPKRHGQGKRSPVWNKGAKHTTDESRTPSTGWTGAPSEPTTPTSRYAAHNGESTRCSATSRPAKLR